MACGTPAVASAVAALPEVAGDAALYVNPHEPGEIADAMARLMGDTTFRQALAAKGSARAASFSWPRARSRKSIESAEAGSNHSDTASR